MVLPEWGPEEQVYGGPHYSTAKKRKCVLFNLDKSCHYSSARTRMFIWTVAF